LRRNHGACAALLNPSSAEPLVWPSPLKFISELNADAKELLEAALMEANLEREKKILIGAKFSCPSPSLSEDGSEDTTSEVHIFFLLVFLLFYFRRTPKGLSGRKL
jgi:hypothetical protein